MIDVEPRLKYAACDELPVLVTKQAWALNVITQEEPEVPALKTPVLVNPSWYDARLIYDVESAVKVPLLVIFIELLPLVPRLKVAPRAFTTALVPEF